jgi:deoxyribonuclease V
MLACLDVHYADDHVRTALLLADSWPASEALTEQVSATVGRAAEYVPGRFYERELPYLVAALAHAALDALRVVVVDAHVWLDGERPGLGAHLYAALDARVPVVGVGKQRYRDQARAPRRASRAQPLTAVRHRGGPRRGRGCPRRPEYARRAPPPHAAATGRSARARHRQPALRP